MKFHIDHTPAPSTSKIDHSQKIFLIGSCFAENIGQRLLEHKFNCHINPYGILFNPISIADCLDSILSGSTINTHNIENNGIYQSFLCHGSIYANSAEALQERMVTINKEALAFLKQADHLILTLGSAHGYRHTALNRVVANCHKQPGAVFEKTLISVSECVNRLSESIAKIRSINPGIQISITVSPVKYLKDGLEANALSKACLLLSAHELCHTAGAHYFPAFELVSDDLRDHRFYKEDLAHPNELAIHYVWEKFSQAYFNEQTKTLNKEISAIVHAQSHRLLFPESEASAKFKVDLEKRISELQRKHPNLKF